MPSQLKMFMKTQCSIVFRSLSQQFCIWTKVNLFFCGSMANLIYGPWQIYSTHHGKIMFLPWQILFLDHGKFLFFFGLCQIFIFGPWHIIYSDHGKFPFFIPWQIIFFTTTNFMFGPCQLYIWTMATLTFVPWPFYLLDYGNFNFCTMACYFDSYCWLMAVAMIHFLCSVL